MILRFARSINIHPGIVVGRLQYEGKLENATHLNNWKITLINPNSLTEEADLSIPNGPRLIHAVLAKLQTSALRRALNQRTYISITLVIQSPA